MSDKVIVRMDINSTMADHHHADRALNEVVFENVVASDGYHTFEELYDHRIELFISLCRLVKTIYDGSTEMSGFNDEVWRSKQHSDGSSYDGWFVLGIGVNKGKQITYHLPMSRWDDTNFAETFDSAPEWDGHTSSDVLERLKNL